jgi:hypothetical protein
MAKHLVGHAPDTREEIPPVVQSLLLEGYWWVAEDTVSTVFEWLRAHPEFHWTVEKKTGYTFFTVSLPSSYWLEHHD